jgi:cephalosporin hydroxylase
MVTCKPRLFVELGTHHGGVLRRLL